MMMNSPLSDKATRYNRINDHFATSKKGKSLKGNTYDQIFNTGKRVIAVYRLQAKEIGIPSVFIGGQSDEQPWNDLIIGHLKGAVRKDLVEFNCPLYLGDYCLERRVRINNLTAKELILLKGETPRTTIYGCEGDISTLSDFPWYEVVSYLDHKQKFPYAKEMLGAGNKPRPWMLRSNGKVIVELSVPWPRSKSHLRSMTRPKKSLVMELGAFKRVLVARKSYFKNNTQSLNLSMTSQESPYVNNMSVITSSIRRFDWAMTIWLLEER